MLRLTDLREILRYVPHFRDKAFVIALDGAIAADDNLGNILLDIALLRSLSIGVVIVHGCGRQVERLAEAAGVMPSTVDGAGVTDPATFDISLAAANRVTHKLLEGLAAVDLKPASPLAVIAHPAGILGGVDHQLTGKVERIDTGLIRALLDRDVVPVIPPLGTDGEGHTYRLNSDAVAVEVALAMQAAKLIYLAPEAGIRADDKLQRQLAVGEAEALLKRPDSLSPGSRSKLSQAVRATKAGVPRVHIIDGREPEGLLAEVFSHEGIGTLVHANEYQSIRPARRKDTRAIYGLIRRGVEADELVARSRGDIERQIDDFYVFEVDRDPVACVALHRYPDDEKAELACLFVDPRHENQGIGLKLVQYVESIARGLGYRELFCLSTQAFNFFQQKGGFRAGTPDSLPPARRERYEKGGRKSQVLVKTLAQPA
jgi:amino-acid N-acetyltransferase